MKLIFVSRMATAAMVVSVLAPVASFASTSTPVGSVGSAGAVQRSSAPSSKVAIAPAMVTRGEAVTLTGRVRNSGGAGVRVSLQTETEGAWSTIKQVKTGKGGKWKVTLKPAESTKFRAQHKVGRKRVNSNAVPVGVQWWINLEDADAKAARWWGDGEVDLNGVTYAHSVYLGEIYGEYGYLTYDTGRECSKFEAVVGVSDDAPIGSVRDYRVTGNGLLLTQGTASWGAPVPVSVDLTGLLEFGIETGPWDVVEGTFPKDENVWFGDARALCLV